MLKITKTKTCYNNTKYEGCPKKYETCFNLKIRQEQGLELY